MQSAVIAPFQEAAKRFDRRFFTTAVIPTLVFLLAYGATIVASVSSFGEMALWWRSRSVAEVVFFAGTSLAITWFIAGLFASNWRKIVRLYEAYWLRGAVRNACHDADLALQLTPGVAYHARRRDILNQSSRGLSILYSRYPPEDIEGIDEDETLPTTLGNILLSGERYGMSRYGLDITLMWPRLFWLLPAEVQGSIDVFKEEHQLPLALSFASAVFSAAATLTVLALRGPWELVLLVGGLGLALAGLAYVLAIERAEEYAEQLRAIVDLYRHELVNAWSDGPRHHRTDATFYARAERFILTGLGPTVDQTPSSPNPRAAASGQPGDQTCVIEPPSNSESEAPPGLEEAQRLGVIGTKASWFLERARLLWLALAAGAVFVVLAAVVAAQLGSAQTGIHDEVGLVSYRLANPPAQPLAIGELVDLVVHPCGEVIRSVTVATPASTAAQHLAFEVSPTQLDTLRLCDATEVTAVQRRQAPP